MEAEHEVEHFATLIHKFSPLMHQSINQSNKVVFIAPAKWHKQTLNIVKKSGLNAEEIRKNFFL